MKQKLFIGLTLKSHTHYWVTHAIIDFLYNSGYDGDFQTVIGEGYVGRARNDYTAKFLASDCTDLLNLDSDVLFDKEKVERIMSHDVDVVGGIYYKKQLKREAVLEPLPNMHHSGNENGLLQVRYMGTGFLRVRRHVFNTMIMRYPIEYILEGTGKVQHHFWPIAVDPLQKRLLSEDWWFCHRAIECGYDVYADTKCVVGHVGDAIYPINTPESSELERWKETWQKIAEAHDCEDLTDAFVKLTNYQEG